MPTYTYECVSCGHAHDLFHAMSATPKVKCEVCGAGCIRMIGTGAGLIFKGSGFYETDYKDKKGTPPTKDKGGNGAEKADGKATGKNGDKSAGKPSETKADSKSTTAKSVPASKD